MFLARLVAKLVMDVRVPEKKMTVFLKNYYSHPSLQVNILCCEELKTFTLWDMFDEGGGSSGDPTDEGSGPASQTLVWQAEKVRYAIPNAAHQAGRTAQDLQRPHHPTYDQEKQPQTHHSFIWLCNRFTHELCHLCKMEDSAYTHFSLMSDFFYED